jgi:hypothetical protein
MTKDEAKDEPYAYIYEIDGPFGLHQSLRYEPYNGRMPDRTVPVYTTPPDTRILQAISDEYNAWIRYDAAGGSFDEFLKVTLKEKNT